MDASTELTELDDKLVDATTRFDRMPGALWLAATAIIESATRLGDLDASLTQRRDDLLVRARRARDDAGPRSSENDVSAITAWVELAEKRAVLERVVQAAMIELVAHRKAHPRLGDAPTTRKQLERALGDREKEVTERAARLNEPKRAGEDTALARLAMRAADASNEDVHSDAEIAERTRAARARLDTKRIAWPVVLPFLLIIGSMGMNIVYPAASIHWVLRVSLAVVAFAGITVAYAVRMRRLGRDLSDAQALRRRDESSREAAAHDLALLTKTARALGAVDAFGATDDGRTLEDRESKLVTLAPWIRELVSGFSADEASRFA